MQDVLRAIPVALALIIVSTDSVCAQSSLIIFPFRNITQQPEDDWIGDGIAETLRTALGQADEVSVVMADDSSSAVETADAVNEARRLGARWLIDGGYQKIDGQIRITARVIDVASSRILDTKRIDGEIDDLFELQDQLVSELMQEAPFGLLDDASDQVPPVVATTGSTDRPANSTQEDAVALRGRAEQGEIEAQFMLGLMYTAGDVVDQDSFEAAQWFQRAANQGYGPSFVPLARAFFVGQGVPQDFVSAHFWFNIAAASLSDDDRTVAIEGRNQVQVVMSERQLAEAQGLARQRTPTAGPQRTISTEPANRRTEGNEAVGRSEFSTAPPSKRIDNVSLTGYIQTVPLYTGSTAFADSSVADFSRFRLSTEPTLGPIFVGVAYEHGLTWRRFGGGAGLNLTAMPGGGEWMPLQWGTVDETHVTWRHRFDRLYVGWSPMPAVEVSAGRQAVSWGTTLFLTPADPFLPFSPADAFRQFRAGVDVARLRLSPSPLSAVEIVVRPTKTVVGEELTALARGLFTVAGWEVSGWAGSLYGDTAAAVGTAGAFGAWAVRGEASFRMVDDNLVVRSTIGADRLFQVGGRDLFLLVEYQRDGFGAADPDDYLALVQSDPFLRGEMQVLGRDETVVQATYQLHPLWGLSGLWLTNLNDQSALWSPGVSYSVSDEAAIMGGLYFAVGDSRRTLETPLPSEYGLTGTTGYLSFSWYF